SKPVPVCVIVTASGLSSPVIRTSGAIAPVAAEKNSTVVSASACGASHRSETRARNVSRISATWRILSSPAARMQVRLETAMRLFTLAVLVFALQAAPAKAQYVEPLPAGTWVLPVDGATHAASSWPQATPFEMQGFAIYLGAYDELPQHFDVAVATSAGTT